MEISTPRSLFKSQVISLRAISTSPIFSSWWTKLRTDSLISNLIYLKGEIIQSKESNLRFKTQQRKNIQSADKTALFPLETLMYAVYLALYHNFDSSFHKLNWREIHEAINFRFTSHPLASSAYNAK